MITFTILLKKNIVYNIMSENLISTTTIVKSYDIKFKVIVCGNSNVGKTSFIKMYSNGSIDNVISTIGVDFILTGVNINDDKENKHIQLQMWDTAGQERFRSVIFRFYKGCHACIIMFDVTNLDSFKSLDYWVHETLKHSSDETLPIIILGNKSRHQKRVVDISDINAWLEKNKYPYIEIDIYNNHNIDEAYQLFTKIIYKKWKVENENYDIPQWGVSNLSIEKRVKYKDYCCILS